MNDMPAGESATYVYCVGYAEPFVDDTLEIAGIGEHAAPVRVIQHDDLVALVSDSPRMRYDISRRNLTAHQRVLEEAMTRSTVLPVSFGTVANSDRDVREKLLKRESDEIHRYLAYVRDRVELGLMVLWNRDRLFAEVVEEYDEIRALRNRLAGLPADTAYYDRIDLGQRTEAAIAAKSSQEAEKLLRALEPLAVETRVNESRADLMILNAAFLVDRQREPEFDAAVQELGEAESERLTFRYVGPLPPHNFVDVSVRWKD
jgi:hypothetical protein